MIVFKSAAAVRAMETAIAALQAQAMALADQIASLKDELARVSLQIASTPPRIERLSGALDELTVRTTTGEAGLRQMLDQLRSEFEAQQADTRVAGEQRDGRFGQLRVELTAVVGHLAEGDPPVAEQIRQLRGNLARVERQGAIDLDELRRTDRALAERLLLAARSLEAGDM